MDLSAHLRTQDSIDSIVASRLNDRSVTIDGIPTQVTVDTVAVALRSLRRTIVCKPECAEQIRAAVEHEGLSGTVDVAESDYVPPGQVFILRPIPRRH